MKKVFKFTLILLATAFLFSCLGKTGDSAMETPEVESSQAAAAEQVTFTGYLVDVTCGKNGKGLDGANLITAPENHTLHCLEVCRASGFGVMTTSEDGETYTFIPFDSNGNAIADGILDNMTEDRSIPIEVTGVLENGTLEVEVLKEA